MDRQCSGPKVGVVMGSASDLPVMRKAADTLLDLEIPHEVRVISAHRTPDVAADYARGACARGIKIIIAGAGAAAHLAGAMAANTVLPVIGVPLASGALGGIDALYSTVQMPPGIPVATVAVGGAENAAILAAQILSLADDGLACRLADRRRLMAEKVQSIDAQVSGEFASCKNSGSEVEGGAN